MNNWHFSGTSEKTRFTKNVCFFNSKNNWFGSATYVLKRSRIVSIILGIKKEVAVEIKNVF